MTSLTTSTPKLQASATSQNVKNVISCIHYGERDLWPFRTKEPEKMKEQKQDVALNATSETGMKEETSPPLKTELWPSTHHHESTVPLRAMVIQASSKHCYTRPSFLPPVLDVVAEPCLMRGLTGRWHRPVWFHWSISKGSMKSQFIRGGKIRWDFFWGERRKGGNQRNGALHLMPAFRITFYSYTTLHVQMSCFIFHSDE